MKKHPPHSPPFSPAAVFWLTVCFMCVPAGLGAAEPSLVDKLLTLLGNKTIPRIAIPAPPLPAAAPGKPASGEGLEIGTSYLPIYTQGDEDNETPSVLPFFANGPVNRVNPRLTTLLIMIPGVEREAARAFAYARSAQDEASARHPEWNAADTFIFVPQFLTPEDIDAHKGSWPDGGKAILRWVGGDWIYGRDSVDNGTGSQSRRNQIFSSYAALDFALLLLARPRILPDLRKVVIAGTGAGGDFVQRYAVLGITPGILAGEGIEVRFVPAQARSYLYLDAFRVKERSSTPLEKGADPEMPEFAPADEKACPAMNAYPFGLAGLVPYGAQQGINELRLRFPERQVIVLTGAGATLPLPDASPQACALAAQGANTSARARNYFAATQRLYGSELDRMQKRYAIKNINEDGLALWRSPCGMAALFGDGGCAPDDTGGPQLRVLE